MEKLKNDSSPNVSSVEEPVQDANFFSQLIQDAKNLRQDIIVETTTCQKVIDGLNAMNNELNKNVHDVDVLLIDAKNQIESIKEECNAIIKAAPHYDTGDKKQKKAKFEANIKEASLNETGEKAQKK